MADATVGYPDAPRGTAHPRARLAWLRSPLGMTAAALAAAAALQAVGAYGSIVVQHALLVALVWWIGRLYWPLGTFYWGLLFGNKVPTLALAFLLAIVFGLLSTPTYGLPSLFWHPHPLVEMSAAASCVLFVSLFWYVIYIVNCDQIREDARWRRTLPDVLGRANALRPIVGRDGLSPGNRVHEMWAFVIAGSLPLLILLAVPGVLPAYRPEWGRYELGPLGLPRNGLAPFWLAGLAGGVAFAAYLWRRRFLFRIAIILSQAAYRLCRLLRLRRAAERIDTRLDRFRSSSAPDQFDASARTNDMLLLYLFVYGLSLGLQALFGPGQLNALFPPAFLLSVVMLGMVLACYAYLASRSWRANVGFLVFAVLAILINGLQPYKNTFPGLEAYYPADPILRCAESVRRLLGREPLRDGTPASLGASLAPNPALLDDAEVLAAWERSCPKCGPAPGRRPKLVVVATSGGGIRAAIWTAVVLGELEKAMMPDDNFPHHVRLITGASGGMVGAAHYVTTLARPGRLRSPVADGVSKDFLGPAVRRMVMRDMPSAFWPFRQGTDRGQVLEESWVERKGAGLDHTFAALRGAERRGEIPSLVFSPMLVEDARRLLISNLSLDQIVTNRGSLLLGGPGEAGLLSQSAVELFRLFPGARGFRVRTAARMSATFPLISPAATLPTDPPRRVVDAGYYDNYGVDLAVRWINKNREWLRDHTSGVLLVQIRAFSNEDEVRSLKAGRPASEDLVAALDRGLQFLTSPLSGMSEARHAVTTFRNDEMIELVDRYFNESGGPGPGRGARAEGGFFSTVIFSCDRDKSDRRRDRQEEEHRRETLSWYVTQEEAAYVRDGMNRKHNSDGMAELQTWWARK
jgi:Patatin-like phospholipase